MPRAERFANTVAGAIGGGIFGTVGVAASEIGYRWDKFTNPQIYSALAKHMDWWQVATTDHSWTVLYLQHEPVSALLTIGVPTALGAVWGVSRAVRNR